MANQYSKSSLASILTEDFLKEEYVNKERFAKDISRDLGCSVVTITNYLRKFGIKVEQRYSKRDIRGLNPARDVLTKEYLLREYVDKERSITNIARELDCSVPLVSEHLKRFGINKATRPSTVTESGYVTEDKGYILVRLPNHRLANYRGYVRLHILLAEHFFGREVGAHEIVHHKNEDKKDNSPSNLEIITKKDHDTYHIKKRWNTGTFNRRS